MCGNQRALNIELFIFRQSIIVFFCDAFATGEEYADVFPVVLQNVPQGSESSASVARLLNGWPRLLAVVLRAICPWLQARWVFIESKVRLRTHHVLLCPRVGALTSALAAACGRSAAAPRPRRA